MLANAGIVEAVARRLRDGAAPAAGRRSGDGGDQRRCAARGRCRRGAEARAVPAGPPDHAQPAGGRAPARGARRPTSEAEAVAQAKALLRARLPAPCCSRAGTAAGETAVDILCDAARHRALRAPARRHAPHARHGLHAVGRHRRPAGPGRGAARGRRPRQSLRLAGAGGGAHAGRRPRQRARSITCSPSAALRRRRDQNDAFVAETGTVGPHFSLFGLHGGIDAGRILGTLRSANGDLE